MNIFCSQTISDVIDRFKDINYVAVAITVVVVILLLTYQEFLKV